ncbi:MAG: nucleoside-diphosphate kinase [Armatimonadetes bacterium]|nr:nucleoside-diphosphate kinase [Armatimonadota bacterium]
MERTFIMVKPDGVRRGLVGEILRRFEDKGLRVVGLKMVVPSRDLAEKHYGVHRDKPFFNDVVEFITSGPVVALVLEGPDAIALTRAMMGKTRPTEAAPGTIRGDYANSTEQNLVHGSDSPETASEEIELWFRTEELLSEA